MNIPEMQARLWFAQNEPAECDFETVLRDFREVGKLLINTEDFFLAAQPMHGGLAWYVYLIAGDLGAVWDNVPDDRPFVCWRRCKNESLHLYRLDRIRRIHCGQKINALH